MRKQQAVFSISVPMQIPVLSTEGIVLSPTSRVTGRVQIAHVTDARVSEQHTLNTKVQRAGRHQVNPNQEGR